MSARPPLSRRWQRVRARTPGQWRVLVEAWGVSALVTIGLRVRSFERLLRWIDRPAPSPARWRLAVTPSDTAYLVSSASARVFGSTCLTRALVLRRLLHRGGVATELVLGTRRTAAGLAAHAWLRHGDEVLVGGGGHDDYRPLWRRSTEGPRVEA